MIEHMLDNGDGTFEWFLHSVDAGDDCGLCGGSGKLETRLRAERTFDGYVDTGA